MKIAPLADVKARLSAYVDHVETEGPVVITRNGKPVAVLLAPRNAEDLERLVLAHSPRFQALLDESRASLAAGKGLSRSSFWKAASARQRKKRQAGLLVYHV
jgi:prevent-host-death family protein